MALNKPEFNQTFKLTKLLLSFLGLQLSPRDSNGEEKWTTFFLKHICHGHFAILFIFICFAVLTISVSLINSRFVQATEMFLISTYIVLGAAKLSSIYFQRSKIGNLVQKLEKIWPDVGVLKEHNILCMKHAKVITTGLAMTYLICFVVLNSLPLLQMLYGYFASGSIVAVLPLNFWTPSGQFYIYMYLSEYLIYTMGVSVIAASILSADFLFILFNAHICMHVELLQINLRNVVEKSVERTKKLNRKPHDDVLLALKKCVERHNQLIEFNQLAEEIFSPSNLVNYFSSSVIICLTGFQITAASGLIRFKFISVLMVSFFQIMLLSVYGQQLIDCSQGVGDAAYECSWYSTDARFRRSLLIIMARAQRPLQYTAMKFYVISMESFCAILSTSYSYLTLLRTVYDDSE